MSEFTISTWTYDPPIACPYCSSDITKVFHQGKCPKIKCIEYHPNGIVKKIEFYSDSQN